MRLIKITSICTAAHFTLPTMILKIYFATNMLLFCVYYVTSTSLEKLLQRNSFFGGSTESDGDVVDLILSKGYLPTVHELPKPLSGNKYENDGTYLLSKLPDTELIKLLDEHPAKNGYDVKDLVQLALENDIRDELNQGRSPVNKQEKSLFSEPQPYFRLENKPVKADSKAESNYNALQKINSLLNSQVQDSEIDDDNREMLFDVLVAQLKTLCCKGHKAKKPSKNLVEPNYQSAYVPIVSKDKVNYESKSEYKPEIVYRTVTTEHMFLILNEEIQSNGTDDLISVDPESLGKNSSVLLLGPLSRPLSDRQLKVVMNRISKEISKPEYEPILKQLSEGSLESPNLGLMKNLITGPETRRYIKPHRCNYQATLSKVFAGTRWIICSGYLNINTPSLYD